jgi:hypothetical protein
VEKKTKNKHKRDYLGEMTIEKKTKEKKMKWNEKQFLEIERDAMRVADKRKQLWKFFSPEIRVKKNFICKAYGNEFLGEI